MTLDVPRLEPTDDRSRFRSGNPALDRFFLLYAGQHQFRHHIGTTYVAVDDEQILGFATVAASELPASALPAALRKRLPRYPLPALRLARLAVDQRARGTGVGTLLFRSVLGLARRLADSVGCVGLIVDSKPEAVSFYETLGFIRCEALAGELGDRPEPVPMFFEL